MIVMAPIRGNTRQAAIRPNKHRTGNDDPRGAPAARPQTARWSWHTSTYLASMVFPIRGCGNRWEIKTPKIGCLNVLCKLSNRFTSLLQIFRVSVGSRQIPYGRASRIILNGVSAARRNRVNPPSKRTSLKRRSPACAPRARPTS
jgi:hypothetical protein